MNLLKIVVPALIASTAGFGFACGSSSTSTPASTDGGTDTTTDAGTETGNADNAHGGAGCLMSNEAGAPEECLIIRINGVSTVASQADCEQGTTFVASCAAPTLEGCCTTVGASDSRTSNVEEDCVYSADDVDGGNIVDNPAQCAMMGITSVKGVWSTTP